MSKEFKDLVLELLDVIDRIRQGGLLAHLNQKGKTSQSKHVRANVLHALQDK